MIKYYNDGANGLLVQTIYQRPASITWMYMRIETPVWLLIKDMITHPFKQRTVRDINV